MRVTAVETRAHLLLVDVHGEWETVPGVLRTWFAGPTRHATEADLTVKPEQYPLVFPTRDPSPAETTGLVGLGGPDGKFSWGFAFVFPDRATAEMAKTEVEQRLDQPVNEDRIELFRVERGAVSFSGAIDAVTWG